MHAVLRTPELRDAIISNFENNPKDLLSVALTCRWFCEPALSLMWYLVDEGGPAANDLLFLLPDAKVEMKDLVRACCCASMLANIVVSVGCRSGTI